MGGAVCFVGTVREPRLGVRSWGFWKLETSLNFPWFQPVACETLLDPELLTWAETGEGGGAACS